MLPVTRDDVVRSASVATLLPGERVGFGHGLRVPDSDEPNGDERAVKVAKLASLFEDREVLGSAVLQRVNLHARNTVTTEVESVDVHQVMFRSPSVGSLEKSDCSEYNKDEPMGSCESIIVNGGLPDMLWKAS
jgi:hypothetical protein